ncbi:hypothetical protein [Streptomyces sp. NBC_00690]|uniref:hypothetical protein n=1 Tax=Streptomyces sp. NBC_00690 TaxID=2975808 RepID=UPI002E2B120B|nr:hypothetical protein [Streptomyces sp. NBC_00690]
MIKISWALMDVHVDEWIGEDVATGAAALEAKVGSVVGASGMKPEAVQDWREAFLTPTVEALRSQGAGALARGESWSTATGPLLVHLDPSAREFP